MKTAALIALASLAAGAAQAQAPAPQAGCTAPEHRQFDFWVGRWAVVNAAGKPAGKSLVEGVYGGCGLRENWTGASGVTGGSLNMYDRTDGKWKQNWIDSAGGRLDYVGGWDGKAMVFTAREGDGLSRMTFTPLADRAVRQHIESSKDGGRTWATAYDLTYRRAE